MDDLQLERAKAMALKMLSRRARSEAEVRRALEKAPFSAEVIAAALARLKELGYLDDQAFARARAQTLLEKGRLGPSAVSRRLAAQGVDEGEAEAAVSDARGGRSDEALAREALSRRRPIVSRASPLPERVKAARFLAGRGFSEGAIEALLGPFEEG